MSWATGSQDVCVLVAVMSASVPVSWELEVSWLVGVAPEVEEADAGRGEGGPEPEGVVFVRRGGPVAKPPLTQYVEGNASQGKSQTVAEQEPRRRRVLGAILAYRCR